MFARIAQYRLDHRLKAAYQRHERLLVPGLLLFGFLVDVITFRNVQLPTMFVLLGMHAVIATAAIAYRSAPDDADAPSGQLFSYLRFLAPLALQFSLGALLSSALLFYWFSGALSASWPVMVLLVLLMASNEVFREAFLRPTAQIGTYAFVLFSYFTLLFPFMLRSLSPWVFLLGGACSTALTLALVAFTTRRSSSRTKERRERSAYAIAVAGVFIALYFLHIIPPVPLSIRAAGIYHHVRSQGGTYQLTGESETFLQRLWPGQTVHADDDGRLYAYVAVFAPTDLETEIVHRWQRWDPETGEWSDQARLSYVIRGGRDEGYRGYTFKTRPTPGKWRVVVETPRGQVLGRIPFVYEE